MMKAPQTRAVESCSMSYAELQSLMFRKSTIRISKCARGYLQ